MTDESTGGTFIEGNNLISVSSQIAHLRRIAECRSGADAWAAKWAIAEIERLRALLQLARPFVEHCCLCDDGMIVDGINWAYEIRPQIDQALDHEQTPTKEG